jgi:hypothetical protein
MIVHPGDLLTGKSETHLHPEDADIERLARAMCKSDGILDVEQRCANFPPLQIRQGQTYVIPDVSQTWPAWQSYVSLAHAALKELKPKIEVVSADRPVPYADWLRDLRIEAYALLKPYIKREDVEDCVKTLRCLLAERVEP